ncbi:MAG: hypothetical protein MK291_13370, partial [Planctomycetes bacterium]|nr:hypothetical protein [Planctomycetota bacterium]
AGRAWRGDGWFNINRGKLVMNSFCRATSVKTRGAQAVAIPDHEEEVKPGPEGGDVDEGVLHGQGG